MTAQETIKRHKKMVEEMEQGVANIKKSLAETSELRKGERAVHMTHQEKVECFKKCIGAVLHDDVGQIFLPKTKKEAHTLANRASAMAYSRYELNAAWKPNERAWWDANESMGWPFLVREEV